MQTLFFTGRVVEMNSLGCPASFISNGYQPGPRRKKENGLHFELEMNIAGVWRSIDAFLRIFVIFLENFNIGPNVPIFYCPNRATSCNFTSRALRNCSRLHLTLPSLWRQCWRQCLRFRRLLRRFFIIVLSLSLLDIITLVLYRIHLFYHLEIRLAAFGRPSARFSRQ